MAASTGPAALPSVRQPLAPIASPRTKPPTEPPQPPEIVEEMSGDELIEEVSAVKAMPEPAASASTTADADEAPTESAPNSTSGRAGLFAPSVTAPAATAAATESPFAAPPKTDDARPKEPTAPPSMSALLAEPRKLFASSPASNDPLADLTGRSLGVVDLPSDADFAYPIKKSGSTALKIFLALIVLGAGFFAAVKFLPLGGSKGDQSASVTPADEPKTEVAKAGEAAGSATDPKAGSGAPVVESSTTDAAVTTGDPTTETTDATDATKATGATDVTKATDTKSTDATTAKSTDATTATKTTDTTKVTKATDTTKATKSTDTTKATKTKTTDATKSTDTTKTTTKTPKTATKTETGDQPTDTASTDTSSDCDEVSCIMTKYDRACCDKYKPQEGFTPKNVTPETLDKRMVKAGIETVKPRIVACGEKTGSKGTVKVAVSVAGEGNVKDVSVTESPDSALGECVAAAVRKAKFGRSIQGAEFVYPFVF